jgi:hypothetical protein
MKDNDKVVSYASMIGSIFLHFVVGSDTQMKLGWDRWKATYYMIANGAGLNDSEASRFLHQTCLILVALGILDPPEGVELDGAPIYALVHKPDETVH